MASIFYEYIQGDVRDELVEEMELACEWKELNLMLEMVQRQEEINQRHVEIKVMKESGTYDDYAYLLEAAVAQAEEQKKGILQRIFEWFGRLFNSIGGLFSRTKKTVDSADQNAQVQVPEEYINLAELEEAGSIADKARSLKKLGMIGGLIAAIGGIAVLSKFKFFKKSKGTNGEDIQGSGKQVTCTVGDLNSKTLPTLNKNLGKIKDAISSLNKEFSAHGYEDQTQRKMTVNDKNKPDVNQATNHPSPGFSQNTNFTAHGYGDQTQRKMTVNAKNKPDVNQATNHSTGGPAQNPNFTAHGYESMFDILLGDTFFEAEENQGGNNQSLLSKLLGFFKEVVGWIQTAFNKITAIVTPIAKRAGGAVKNVANKALDKVRRGKNATDAAAQTIDTAQAVVSSAETDPIKDNEKYMYESVFGEEYQVDNEEDKALKEFQAIFDSI